MVIKVGQRLDDLQPGVVASYLQRPQAIRDRCRRLFHLAQADQLQHLGLDLGALPTAAAYVQAVMDQHYPTGKVPFHSRWRHFEVDGQPRWVSLESELSQLSALEQARVKVDLAITSVLLDAGAGPQWCYREPQTGRIFQRSEGLAIASFHSFAQGLFSSQPDAPWQADADGLRQLTVERLAHAFQVSDHNPLLGLEGRITLLQTLGRTLAQQPHLFGADQPRPGHLVDYWLQQAPNGVLPATTLLQTLLEGLGDIWPGRITLAGRPLGDVWFHPQLPDTGPGSQLVPFHKLSQWLTYSLLEPLQDLGLTITAIDQLTGLAEYRNGGLFIDCGVITLKHPQMAAAIAHPPHSPLIVEWRALTLCLLDELATHLRQTLNLSPAQLPLAKLLQGGTWTAGRQIAAQKRPGGPPPITLLSDGTVF